jgi:hypothetical protein
VKARVGYDPFFPWAALTVITSIRREGKALSGHVEIVDADGLARGMRDMTNARGDCSELVTSMALAISIALDTMDRATPPAAPTPEPAPAPEPPSPTAAAPSPMSASAEEERPTTPEEKPARVVLDAALGPVVSAGFAPQSAVGGVIAGRLRWPVASVAIEGRVDLPSSRDASSGRSVSTSLRSGAVVPCMRWRVLAGCGVGMVGALATSGTNLSASETVAPYVGAGARIAAEPELAREISLSAFGEALATITGAQVRVDGADLWRSPAAAFSVGAMLFVHF